ncbi:MAG TPA: HRDC domain-containing protein [Candidatus Nesterenkonia stercoripullorum]|uniref:HRDC domain-containing protein n=1 Tax=Candidatus Nesterenkonia stercoripullorum TaxID=2838701 RepID=A0A9D1RZT2_9MICC|nr:HRDC domain-containing protein [Candidatus Nesterenkonia stercoripullorum]
MPEDLPPLMTEPENGVPFVIDTDRGLARCADALSMGEGPVAIDAERASGFRYGQRAFLVQLKREGSGLWLIDPEAFSTLAPLQDALGEAEWILHAAGQDLPCLAEVGLSPHALFDTELAARLAGLPRVGLGAVVEGRLGVRLAKEHSAADWSRRPLPEDWLRYAALDVDLLIPLRNNLEALLREDGKLEWARAEFEHLRVTPTTGAPLDARWRKTSKLSRLKSPRKLAILRELWMTRELFAQSKDVAPGHVLPDSALVAAAEASPRTVPQLLSVDGFHGRAAKRQAPRWLHAIQTGAKTQELPEMRLPASGPPAPRLWRDRNPLAFRQYRTARQWIADRAEALNMMPEVLLTPAVLKAVCWEPPEKIDLNTVSEALRNQGARAWQIEQCAAVLTVALLDPDPLESL